VEVDGAAEDESGWASVPCANDGRSERKWSGGSIGMAGGGRVVVSSTASKQEWGRAGRVG